MANAVPVHSDKEEDTTNAAAEVIAVATVESPPVEPVKKAVIKKTAKRKLAKNETLMYDGTIRTAS